MINLPLNQLLADSVFALTAAADALYAARTSGLYRSRDGGASWQNVSAAVAGGDAVAVTALAAAGSTVIAGATGAIFRSDDGENWQVAPLASPPPTVVALAVSPDFERDGIAAAGTADDGIFVSADRGATWIPWNFGLVDPHVNALAFSPDFGADHTICAGTESGVFRSQNGGRSWRETAFPLERAPVLSLGLRAADQRLTLYAGTERHGLFRSDDVGQTWQAHGDFAAAVAALHVEAAAVRLLLDDALLELDAAGALRARQPLPADKQALALLLTGGAALIGCADGDILRLS